MQHRNSKKTADQSAAGASEDHAEVRPSAIERQIAATSGFSVHAASQSVRDNTARRTSSRFGWVGLLVLLLIVAGALALLFTDSGRPLRIVIGNALLQPVERVVDKDSLSATQSPPTIKPSQTTMNSSPTAKSLSPATNNPLSASNSISASAAPASANAAQATVSENAQADVISIPAADVSLRNRPELLKQLVQIYRAQLADDPNNSTARAAFNQLQEQSLAELQTIVLEGDEATAIKSLDVVSRIFPEVADNARYQYLVARTDRIAQIKDAPPTKPEPSPAIASIVNSPPAQPAEKNISPADDASPAGVEKAAAKAPPAKPEVKVLSMTAGTLVDDGFIPGAAGDFFLVEISYRNFTKVSEGADEALLVARLGVPGDPSVWAEVPVEILGDRGKKSFVMANMMPGNTGGKYRFNFISNGEFLASSTARVSMPEQ